MVFTPEDAAQELQNNKNTLPKFSEMLVDLNVKDGDKKVLIRPVGFLKKYVRYSPFKPVYKDVIVDGVKKQRKDREPMEFFDADLSKSFYRNGYNAQQLADAGLKECPYEAAGYDGQDRFAQNVLEMYEDGTFTVKVMDGPKSLWEDMWKYEKANADRNKARGTDKFITNLGGAKSMTVEILAEESKRGKNKGADYTTSFVEQTEISDEEIAALAKAGKPSDEAIAKIRADHAGKDIVVNAPDWMFYGYPLDKLFKPFKAKTSTDTSTDESEDDDVDNDAPATPARSRTAATGRAAAKPAETAPAATATAEPASADAPDADEEW